MKMQVASLVGKAPRRMAGVAKRKLYTSLWQVEHSMTRRREGTQVDERQASWVASLQNRLPNSGPIPIDMDAMDPDSVIEAAQDVRKRQTLVEGFEGLALDDALVYTNAYKDMSFFPLTQAIAQICRTARNAPLTSVLELGCGSGHMRRFFESFGASDYLGVDANPIAFRHSCHIVGYEEYYRLLNLQEEINFAAEFDLVCTFEVLEHIHTDRLDGMLATIRNHMRPDSLFIGTASLVADFDVHITVHSREWWLQRFAKHGLVPHPDQEGAIRLLARNHPFNWNGQNTNLFVLQMGEDAS